MNTPESFSRTRDTDRFSVASHETLISLQQLDPSPIDTPPDVDKQLPDLPAPSPPPRSSTLGLNTGSHGPIYYLSRVQRYSSYVFTVYTAFHITNTSLIPLITRSVPASDPYLLLTRPYYQSFPLEPLLITLPIATHILSGIAMRVYRRNANLARYGGSNLPISARFEKHIAVWPKMSWSSISGYILAPLLISHAFVNRGIPLIHEGGSSGVGLAFVSHGFAKHPFLSYTTYIALVTVGVGHFVWGIARWQNWIPYRKDKNAKRRWWTINGISAALVALWMAGGLGVVARGGKADGWVGKAYDVLYAKIPLWHL